MLLNSPNFPLNYPQNIQCTWNILGSAQTFGIQLKIINFHLEDYRCKYDYLDVYADDNHVNKLCGWQSNLKISANHNLTIIFKTDDNVQYTGFLASYYSGNFYYISKK